MRIFIQIKKEKKGFVVDTSMGQFIAHQVIDTRPNQSILRKLAPLHQIFYGIEIKKDVVTHRKLIGKILQLAFPVFVTFGAVGIVLREQ